MRASDQCRHLRTRLIAEDEQEKYVECLDCGAILEQRELKPSDTYKESLADA